MSENTAFGFIDCVDVLRQESQTLGPIVIKKKAIDLEIERLASLTAPINGRRASLVSNPSSGIGNGLTQGIAVAICVLKPGEQTTPVRHNSSLVNFCIHGRGDTIINGHRFTYRPYDVWTTPPWSTYQHFNETGDLQVRLTYSNSPLLKKLGVHIVDETPEMEGAFESHAGDEPKDNARISPYGTFQLTEEGAFLMPYEKLIDPPPIDQKPLHWPWQSVKVELDKLRALGQQYVGRRLYLLYDRLPAERTEPPAVFSRPSQFDPETSSIVPIDTFQPPSTTISLGADTALWTEKGTSGKPGT